MSYDKWYENGSTKNAGLFFIMRLIFICLLIMWQFPQILWENISFIGNNEHEILLFFSKCCLTKLINVLKKMVLHILDG